MNDVDEVPVSVTTLLEMTDRVQSAISDGDWQRALELEVERRSLLERFIADEVARYGELEHLRGTLRDFQTRNNQLIGELHHHRRRLLREAATVTTGRKAVDAYTDMA